MFRVRIKMFISLMHVVYRRIVPFKKLSPIANACSEGSKLGFEIIFYQFKVTYLKFLKINLFHFGFSWHGLSYLELHAF